MYKKDKIKYIKIIEQIIYKIAQNDCDNWHNIARKEQLEPDGDWNLWLIMAGRGFGKTRTGSQTIWKWIKTNRYKNIALIGQSIAEAKQVMIEGHSGILSVIPKIYKPIYKKSDNTIIFKNGAKISIFGADFYEKLRGPQFDAAWVDELAKFKFANEFWKQLSLCLRLGEHPKCIITTTPKKNKLLEQLINDKNCFVTKGSTFDNAKNLSKVFLDSVIKQFEGTSFANQELFGQYLVQNDNALWKRDLIVYEKPIDDNWLRIVIGVDPAVSDNENSDETGIVIIGLHQNQKAYVLFDASLKAKPYDWAKVLTNLYYEYKADKVVVETNKGGDLVINLLRSLDKNIAIKEVRATRGKWARAEPIVSLYEQKKQQFSFWKK